MLYDRCGEHRLRRARTTSSSTRHGGFYFTDLRQALSARPRSMAGSTTRQADGSRDRRGRLPDDHAERRRPLARRQDRLCRRDRDRPPLGLRPRSAGQCAEAAIPVARMAAAWSAACRGYQRFDSLAVEASGNICVATLISGCITRDQPRRATARAVPTGDLVTTNICFGGPDRRTAYITLSGSGQLVEMPWPRAGLARLRLSRVSLAARTSCGARTRFPFRPRRGSTPISRNW